MVTKGASNFTKQVTKELIREQKRKQKEIIGPNLSIWYRWRFSLCY